MVSTVAFTKSMKSAPTIGTTKKALGEGPLAPVKVSILAMALGVAPSPKPQRKRAFVPLFSKRAVEALPANFPQPWT